MALNYDPLAACDDGSCSYCVDGCTDDTLGGYNFPDIYGNCVDGLPPSQFAPYCNPGKGYVITNYDPNATCDDGSCIIAYGGCMDPLANNYDPNAHYDDGSCLYDVYGCTDPSACNYDTLVTIDDGSCCYVSGCTDSMSTNYDLNACCNDGSCTPVIWGCTDSVAVNYYAGADGEDGSCIYAGCMDTSSTAYGWISTKYFN